MMKLRQRRTRGIASHDNGMTIRKKIVKVAVGKIISRKGGRRPGPASCGLEDERAKEARERERPGGREVQAARAEP